MFRGESGFCLSVQRSPRCDLTYGVEGGWKFLHRPPWRSELLAGFLDWLWLGLLTLPIGLLAPGFRLGFLAGLFVVAMAALFSWTSPWLSVHVATIFAPPLGMAGGFWIKGWVHSGPRIASSRLVQDP